MTDVLLRGGWEHDRRRCSYYAIARFLGAFLGSLIFLPLLLAGHKKLVPFGIFLSIGAATAYLVGPRLVMWYGRLITGA